MPVPLTFLVATMTGTAEALAEDLQSALGTVRPTQLRLLEDVTPDDFAALPLALVVSSTYGLGEVPETAEESFRALRAERPDLSGLVYGVISLGDRGYAETFAQGGRNWDEVLSDCGARRAGELLQLDSQSGDDPLVAAKPWLEGWLASADAMLRAIDGAGRLHASRTGT